MEPELEPYKLQPPSWRLPLSGSSLKAGIPDYYPPADDSIEMDLSEPHVRSGIPARPVVGNETFSAHDMIYDRLKSPEIIHQLNGFMAEIVKRREELQRGRITPFAHKVPSRVTLNDSKLATYVRDLADASVPLIRLAKSVPHGFKGERLFDMLYNGSSILSLATASTSKSTLDEGPQSVPLDRALWFVQAVGASDMQSSRNKVGQGQIDSTNTLTSWIRRQLAGLTVPEPLAEAVGRLELSTASDSLEKAASSQMITTTAQMQSSNSSSQRQPRSRRPMLNISIHPSSRPAGGDGQTPPGSPLVAMSPGILRSAIPSARPSAMAIAMASPSATPVLDSASFPSFPSAEGISAEDSDASSQRWAHKWSYSMALARSMEEQHLLHAPTWARFQVELLQQANVTQLPFAIEILRQGMDEVVKSSVLANGVIKASLKAFRMTKAVILILNELQQQQEPAAASDAMDTNQDAAAAATMDQRTQAIAVHESCVKILQSFVRFTLASCSQAVVDPKIWPLLKEEVQASVQGDTAFQGAPNFDHVGQRCALLNLDHLRTGPKETWFDQTIADIAMLDSIDISSDLSVACFNYFTAAPANPPHDSGVPLIRSVKDKLETLFLWSCTGHRSGDYRAFLAVDFVARMSEVGFRPSRRNKALGAKGNRPTSSGSARQAHQTVESGPVEVHSFCMQFIGRAEECAAPVTSTDEGHTFLLSAQDMNRKSYIDLSFPALVALLQQLAQTGYFSMRKFLRKLTSSASGSHSVTANLSSHGKASALMLAPSSLHLRLLRALPFPATAHNGANLMASRRLLIYGSKKGETWEEAAERRAKRELTALCETLFQGPTNESISSDAEVQSILAKVPHLWSSPPFVQQRVLHQVLWSAIEAADAAEKLSLNDLNVCMAIARKAADYTMLGHLLRSLLHFDESTEKLDLVASTIERDILLWHISGVAEAFVQVLASHVADSMRALHQPCKMLLIRLQREGSLAAEQSLQGLSEPFGALQTQIEEEILVTLRTSFHRPEELALNLKGCIEQYGSIDAVAAASFQAALEMGDDEANGEGLRASGFIDMLVDLVQSLQCNLDRTLSLWAATDPAKRARAGEVMIVLLEKLHSLSALSSDAVVRCLILPRLDANITSAVSTMQRFANALSVGLDLCDEALSAATRAAATSEAGDQSEVLQFVELLHSAARPSARSEVLARLRQQHQELWASLITLLSPNATVTCQTARDHLTLWSAEEFARDWLQLDLRTTSSSDAENLANEVRSMLLAPDLSMLAAQLMGCRPNYEVIDWILAGITHELADALRSDAEVDLPSVSILLHTLVSMPTFKRTGTLPQSFSIWPALLAAAQRLLEGATNLEKAIAWPKFDLGLDLLIMACQMPATWAHAGPQVASDAISTLFGALGKMVRRSSATTSRIETVLDVILQILISLPLDTSLRCRQLLAGLTSEFDLLEQMPSELHLHAIQTLCPAWQRSPMSTLIVARSLHDAVRHGQFHSVQDKSWELTPLLEHEAIPDLRKTFINPSQPLHDNGTISLAAFGAVKLRDTIMLPELVPEEVQRVAHDDTQVTRYGESERSYGENRADPAPAQAARRGYVLLGEKLTAIGKGQTPLVPAPAQTTAAAGATRATPAKVAAGGGGGAKGQVGASKLSQSSMAQVIEISDNSDEEELDKAPVPAAAAKTTGRKRTSSGAGKRKASKDSEASAAAVPTAAAGQKRRRSNTGSSNKR